MGNSMQEKYSIKQTGSINKIQYSNWMAWLPNFSINRKSEITFRLTSNLLAKKSLTYQST